MRRVFFNQDSESVENTLAHNRRAARPISDSVSDPSYLGTLKIICKADSLEYSRSNCQDI